MSPNGSNGSQPAPTGKLGTLGGSVLVLGVASITALVFWAVTDPLVSWQAVSIASVGIAIFVILCIALSTSPSGLMRSRNMIFALWFILIGSEEVFSYMTDESDSSVTNNFSSGAYSEAMIWVFVALALFIYTLRNYQYLRGLFSGSYKWAVWFGVVCLVSVSYAEQRNFSLAWSFKLWLVILLIKACAYEIENFEDLTAFLRVTFWGFAFLVFAPFLRLLANPTVLAEGRLYDVAAAPTMLSADAATLILLALTLAKPGRRGLSLVVATLAFGMMLLAGGKAGIVAGVFSAIVFFVLQGKVGAAFRYVVGFAVVGILVLAFTPVSSYLSSYASSDLAFSFTGRTDVWSAGWNLIQQHPIIGRGYMSSRFLSSHISVVWNPEHLHDGFLEAFYNNGIIGLFLLVMMHYAIVRNLSRVMRASHSIPYLNQFAVGCLAVYLNVLINGLVSRAFGSRPDATFMVIFALVYVSDRLQSMVPQAEVATLPEWRLTPAPTP